MMDIFQGFERIVDKGSEPTLIRAALMGKERVIERKGTKEGEEEKTLGQNAMCLSCWMYGGEPPGRRINLEGEGNR